MGDSLANKRSLIAASIEGMWAMRTPAARANGNDQNEDAAPATEDQGAHLLGLDEHSHSDNYRISQSESKQPGNSIDHARSVEAIRDSAVPTTALGQAALHIAKGVHVFGVKACAAFDLAIIALKKIGIVEVAKAAGRWAKDHPWEAAAVVIPIILLACTPAILGAVGFTAGGIAAGSIAAGVHAGIGSVATGSVFAILTSAGMGGFGVPIVLGSVWAISSATFWGLAAWKRWRGGEHDRTGRHGETDRLLSN